MTPMILQRGCLLAALLVLWLIPERTAAQVPPPGTPPAQVQQQIDALGLRGQLLARLQSSGMTPEQIRSRLASMGYDPRTLDPYLTQDSVPPPAPTASTLAAIRALGMPDLADAAVPQDRPAPPPPTEEELRLALRVFGVEVFSTGTNQFEPVTMGAVPSDYVLGPGDELVLIITGDVEFVHTLPVTREGFILIPQVGQVWVNGLTREQLRDQLYTRLGQVYSGISRGAGATTQFEISIARLRTNQIYISGEVARPGAYTVSPLASVLNALYQAGGPTANGSFREVHVLRRGEVVHRVDLYEFLLRGDNLDRIRLEPGDVIFVPVHGTHVSARGEVIRGAIFELKPGETLVDLLAFAGGTTAPAHLQRARLTRVLPPAQRTTPGVDRVVIDVDLGEAITNPAAAPRLEAGDELQVLAVASTVRNMVSLNGSVWRPGSYEFRPGMRVSDLLDAGSGLTPEAFEGLAHITRMNPADSSLIMIAVSLRRDDYGKLLEDPPLQEFDVVSVYSRGRRVEELPVVVTGEVRETVTERFQEGMTLRDAIIRAGGLRITADPVVEVSRLADPSQREQGGIAQIFRVQVDSTYFVSDESARHYMGDPAGLRAVVGGGAAAQFRLQPHDRIFVRRIPQFELPRVVNVVGEVLYPGNYTLQRKDERLRDLIGRAGGLTPTGHADGFRLYRDSNLVNVDLTGVLARPDHPDNVILLPGDSLVVPEFNPVVLVQGAVNSPTAVLYKRGAGLDYYISNAGGYARNADRGRVHVRYANGAGRTTQRTVFFRSQPEPEPGSVVTVPLTPTEERTDMRALISDVAQILGVLATVVLVAVRR